MKRDQALPIAERLLEYLKPAAISGKIQIAGSLARGEENVTDIDIVLAPDPAPPPAPRAVFGEDEPKVYRRKIDQLIGERADLGEIIIKKDGPRSKRFFLIDAGISVDLSIVSLPARFGVIIAIRNGPFEFSHWIVTRRNRGGALPKGFRVQGGAVFLGEDKQEGLERLPSIGFDTERALFDWLELEYLEPKDRRAEWGKFGGRTTE